MKIILCLPGNNFSNSFLLSIVQLVKECGEAGIELAVANSFNTVVSFARNACLGGSSRAGANQKPFGGKIEYDYLLWIDSDMIFNMMNIKQLIDSAKKHGGIVSGIYKMSDNKHFAVCQNFDTEYLKVHGSYEYLTAETMPKEPFIADGIGFGFCMVKHGVFEGAKYPWFRHNDLSQKGIDDELSEDLSFCENIRGVANIIVDPSIRVGHLKLMVL